MQRQFAAGLDKGNAGDQAIARRRIAADQRVKRQPSRASFHACGSTSSTRVTKALGSTLQRPFAKPAARKDFPLAWLSAQRRHRPAMTGIPFSDALAQAYAHCETLTRDHDRDRWLAGLFAPADARRHLYALTAFSYEVGRLRDFVREPLRARCGSNVARSLGWAEARSHGEPGRRGAQRYDRALRPAVAGLRQSADGALSISTTILCRA